MIEEGKENDVLIHLTVEEASYKFSQINQTRANTVCEMQQVLASPSDYDLANGIANSVVGSIPFTRRDVRIANIIHGRNIAGMKGKTTKKPSKMQNPDEVQDVPKYIVKIFIHCN